MMTMRHLLTEYVKALGAPGQGIVKRIDAAIDFVDSLLATNPACVKAQPALVERMKSIEVQNVSTWYASISTLTGNRCRSLK